MSTERTPEEHAKDALDEAKIRAVLDDIRSLYASWIVADQLDEPTDVCEAWVDRVWNTTRERLDPQQRAHAILLLLRDGAREEAQRTLTDLRAATS